MTVIDSHDIALALQHKIEAMVDVERAFVHVDHQERDGLEHKVKSNFLHFIYLSLISNILVALHLVSFLPLFHATFYQVERELVRGNGNNAGVGASGDSSSVQIRCSTEYLSNSLLYYRCESTV